MAYRRSKWCARCKPCRRRSPGVMPPPSPRSASCSRSWRKTFLTAGPAVWQDGRNARAAVTYTLSGGSPRLMRSLLALNPPIAVDADLATGALAYIENREDEARKRLSPLDARALPMSLGGQVALVQAGLVAREDLPKANSLARRCPPADAGYAWSKRRPCGARCFSSPRPAISIASSFFRRQYLRRFGTSIYAEDFRQRFATAIARLGIADGDDRFPRLEAILKSSDPENQRALFLQLAQAAVVHGKLSTARSAAADAAALAPLGGGDAMRAGLYDSAASIGPGKGHWCGAKAPRRSQPPPTRPSGRRPSRRRHRSCRRRWRRAGNTRAPRTRFRGGRRHQTRRRVGDRDHARRRSWPFNRRCPP